MPDACIVEQLLIPDIQMDYFLEKSLAICQIFANPLLNNHQLALAWQDKR